MEFGIDVFLLTETEFVGYSDRSMPAVSLDKLFRPASVAVVGASRDVKKLGNIVVKNLVAGGFKGKIFPINPEAETLYGWQVFADYSVLPETPDLAIIAVPAVVAMDILPKINEKGTKHIVILSAGFKEEHGEEGANRELHLKQMAADLGLVVLGPNCLGLVNLEHAMNATFGNVVDNQGNLRFLSQSGAIATSLFDYASYCGLGFSQFVTLGNKTLLSENEILDYWTEATADENEVARWLEVGMSPYQPVGMYLESIEHGQDFMKIAKRLVMKNPLFVLKPGKSEGAAKAMKSHTGAMAGEDAVLDAALQQVGIIRCDGIEDVFDFVRLFSWETAPAGPRLAVVSNAGGPAVMTADAIAESGLELAPLTDETRRILEKSLPRAASLLNPVDVLGDALADRYAAAIEAVFKDENVDALVIILTPQVMTQIEETAEVIGHLAKQFAHKPVVCAFMGGTLISHGEQVLNGYRIPSFRYPERAVRALGKMWWWKKTVSRFNSKTGKAEQDDLSGTRTISKLIQAVRADKRETLTAIEANSLLGVSGIPVPSAEVVNWFEDAKKFVRKHRGWPVVLKLSSAEAWHKTELGGVITDLKSFADLGEAMTVMKHIVSLSEKNGDTSAEVMIQKQVKKGLELIVGIKRDPSFGPVLLFGAGGTMANLIHDRNLRVLPISRKEIDAMMDESKMHSLLKGFRGQKGFAIEKLGDLIEKLARLVLETPDIEEVEINPVIVTRTKAWAVDGKIRLREGK